LRRAAQAAAKAVTVAVERAAVPARIGAGSRPSAEVALIAAAEAAGRPSAVAPLSDPAPVERSGDCPIAVQQEAAEAEG